MISACKTAVGTAYQRIGESDEDGARQIAERLEFCGIRDACPYARACRRTLQVLRRDLSGTADGLPVVSGARLLPGDEALI